MFQSYSKEKNSPLFTEEIWSEGFTLYPTFHFSTAVSLGRKDAECWLFLKQLYGDHPGIIEPTVHPTHMGRHATIWQTSMKLICQMKTNMLSSSKRPLASSLQTIISAFFRKDQTWNRNTASFPCSVLMKTRFSKDTQTKGMPRDQ